MYIKIKSNKIKITYFFLLSKHDKQEKGPECFDQRKNDLIDCMNSTFSDYLPAEKDISTNTLPSVLPELVIGQKQCE